MEINVAVCDDNIVTTNTIEKLLVDIAKKYSVNLKIDIFYDGLILIDYMKKQNMLYNLIYLDIEMNNSNGIEIAHTIRSNDFYTLIIFVSNYDNYFREMLEVEPFRFLDKPINNDLFERYFLKALEKIEYGNGSFVFKYMKNTYSVRYKDIRYFESNKRIIHIIGRNNTFKFYGKLNSIEKIVLKEDKNFMRIHQSYLVNMQFVSKVTFSNLLMDDGTTLNISMERQKNVRERYFNLVGEELLDYDS